MHDVILDDPIKPGTLGLLMLCTSFSNAISCKKCNFTKIKYSHRMEICRTKALRKQGKSPKGHAVEIQGELKCTTKTVE
jgi:hypothetical protein